VAYRIIVADPSPSVQKLAQLVFPEPDFRIFPIEDGPSLLEAVDGVRPDAIIVSLSLEARGGEGIGRVLRGRAGLENVPLVGLRGAFGSADAEGDEAPDYDEIVQKPFDSERLAASVRRLIARKTGPATMPEDPVGPDAERTGAAPDAGQRPHGGPPAEDPGLREWVRGEMVGMEREIEKRVRARVLAEIKEWMARGDRPDGGGE
jgi:DNA-binding response OmpR family regulator